LYNIFSVLVWLKMLLFGKTHEKHPGDLPPTVPDLPLIFIPNNNRG